MTTFHARRSLFRLSDWGRTEKQAGPRSCGCELEESSVVQPCSCFLSCLVDGQSLHVAALGKGHWGLGGSTRIEDQASPCPAQPWIHPSAVKIHTRSKLFILQRSPRTWSLWVRTTRKKKKIMWNILPQAEGGCRFHRPVSGQPRGQGA